MNLVPATSMRGRVAFAAADEWDGEVVEGSTNFEVDFAYDQLADALELRITSRTSGGLGHDSLDEIRIFFRSELAFCRESQSSSAIADGNMRGVEVWEAMSLSRLAGPAARALCLAGISGPDPRLLSGQPVLVRVRPTAPSQVPLVPSLALFSFNASSVIYRVPHDPIPIKVARQDRDRLELSADWPLGEEGLGRMRFAAAWWPAPGLAISPPRAGEFTGPFPVILGTIASPVESYQCRLYAATGAGEPVCFKLQAGARPEGLGLDDAISLDLTDPNQSEIDRVVELDIPEVNAWGDLNVVAVRAKGRSWPGNRAGSAVGHTVSATITDIEESEANNWIDVLLDPPLPALPGSHTPRELSLDGELSRAAGLQIGDLVSIYRSLRLGEDPMGWIDWVERVRDGAILLNGRPWEFPLGPKPLLKLSDDED